MTCIITQITEAEKLAENASDVELTPEDNALGEKYARARIDNPGKQVNLNLTPNEFVDDRIKVHRVHTSTEGDVSPLYVPENWKETAGKRWYTFADRLNRLANLDPIVGKSGVKLGDIPEKFEAAFIDAQEALLVELKNTMQLYKDKVVTKQELENVIKMAWRHNERKMFSPGKALGTENGNLLSSHLKEYNDSLDGELGGEPVTINLKTFRDDAMKLLTPPEKPKLDEPIRPEMEDWDSSLDQEKYQQDFDDYEVNKAKFEKQQDAYIKGELDWEPESPEQIGIWTKFNNAQKDIDAIHRQMYGSQEDLNGGFSVRALREQAIEAQEMLYNMKVSSWDELPDKWYDKVGRLNSEQVSLGQAKKNITDLVTYLNNTADKLEKELQRIASHVMNNLHTADSLEKAIQEMSETLEEVSGQERLVSTPEGQAQIKELEYGIDQYEQKVKSMLEGKVSKPFKNTQQKTPDEIVKELYDAETETSLKWKSVRDEFKARQSENRSGKGNKTRPSENLQKVREMFDKLEHSGTDTELNTMFSKWLNERYERAKKAGNTPEKREAAKEALHKQVQEIMGITEVPKRWNLDQWKLEKIKFGKTGEMSEEFKALYEESGSDVVMTYEKWLTDKIESRIELENPKWLEYQKNFNTIKDLTPELQRSKKVSEVGKTIEIKNLANRDELNKVGQLEDIAVENVKEISDTTKHDAQTAMEQDGRNVEDERIIEFIDENLDKIEGKSKGEKYTYKSLSGDGAKFIKQKLKKAMWAEHKAKKETDIGRKLSKEETVELSREYREKEITDQEVMDYLEDQIIEQDSMYNQKKLFKYGDEGMNSILPNVNLVNSHSVMTSKGTKLIDSLNKLHNHLAKLNKSVEERTIPQRVSDLDLIRRAVKEEDIIPDSIKGLYVKPVRNSELKRNLTTAEIKTTAERIQRDFQESAEKAKQKERPLDNVAKSAGVIEYSENNWQNRIRESNYRKANALEKQRMYQEEIDALRAQLRREKTKQVVSKDPPCS